MRSRALSIALLAVAGCAADPDVDVGVTQQTSLVATVAPATADPSDTLAPRALEYAYAGFPVGPGLTPLPGYGHLVVFLHGGGGTPGGYTTIMQHANSLGFHVVGIEFYDLADAPGSPSMDDLCGGDSACIESVLAAMFACTAGSPLPVNANTCVKDRLDKLLEYLVGADPTHNWGQFRNSGHPDWTKIVIAGHSQGGNLAAYIAQHKPVERLVMIGAPGDPKDWLNDPLQPGPDNAYGLVHVQDQVAGYQDVKDCWTLLGMTGEWCVDSLCLNVACSPLGGGQYCGAHRLRTMRSVANTHNSPAQDTSYASTWTYMFTDGL